MYRKDTCAQFGLSPCSGPCPADLGHRLDGVLGTVNRPCRLLGNVSRIPPAFPGRIVQRLGPLIAADDLRVVAVVGTSKNAGKTTTLNRILERGRALFGPVGLVSIGVDGEEADFWLGHAKPRIRVRPGDRFATAEGALSAATADVAIGVRTGRSSVLGELVVATVTGSGAVLLAGVRAKADLRALIDGLWSMGAGKILIDGSYQRTMAAAPDVSDGVVVATGAVLGPTVERVAERTEAFVARLRLPVMAPNDVALLARATHENLPWVAGADGPGPCLQALDTAFGTPAALSMVLPPGDSALAVPGVVTDSLIDGLVDLRGRSVRLLVSDATRVFASWDRVARFLERGGSIRVQHPIRVLAITVNPAGIVGPDLPADRLVDAIGARIGDVPVMAGQLDPDAAPNGGLRGDVG